MTKCLLKALKAVDLERHMNLFLSLGYESAGALTSFRADDFDKLQLNEQELLRLISLLDVLKETSAKSRTCSNRFQPTNIHKQPLTGRTGPIRACWNDDSQKSRSHQTVKSQVFDKQLKTKRSMSSFVPVGRKSSMEQADDLIFQRSSTVTSRSPRISPIRIFYDQSNSKMKALLNRPAIEHVKVRSYDDMFVYETIRV
jgi:hypothetical protein